MTAPSVAQQDPHAAAQERFAEAIRTGQAFHWAAQSHAGRRLGGPPVARECWAHALSTIAQMADRSDALARVVDRVLAVPSRAHPGPWGQTIVSIRLEDEQARAKVGGDMSGPLSWARSTFRAAALEAKEGGNG